MKHRILILTAALFWSVLPAAGTDWTDAAGLPSALLEFTPSPSTIPIPPAARTRPLICVDPGHPNSFSSALYEINGTNENHINWAVALKLEKELKEKGFEVLMTKTAELEYVENKQRALMANRAGAALCVHLHCETTPGSGFAVYHPDRPGTHNYKDDPDNGFKGPDKQVIDASLALAKAVRKGMARELAGTLADGGIRGDSLTLVGERQGALTASIFSRIPTITIEMVVLTNKSDAAFIKSQAGQLKMAQAIAAGILQYQTP